MAGLICRHCGNTGIAWDTNKPCGCPAGKAYVHIERGNEVEAQRIIVDSLVAAQPAQASEPRAIIQAFAAAMERKMAANDDRKGTWRQSGTFHLLGAMHQEVNEFVDALNTFINLEDDGAPDDILAKARDALCDEAADVANYLAMVLDVCSALPPTDDRGR